jgi:hypothetical protein
VEGDDLGDLQRRSAFGLQTNLNLVSICRQFVAFLLRHKGGVVIRQTGAEQTALRDIVVRARSSLEQHQGLALIHAVRMLQQCETADVTADRADFRFEQVGLDSYRLGFRTRRLLCRGYLRTSRRKPGLRLGLILGDNRFLLYVLLRMLIALPSIPDQHQRKRKNQKQEKSL